MKNITLSAKEDTIEQARKVATNKGTTLNNMFRNWLDDLSNETTQDKLVELNKLWAKTGYVKAGRKFTHQELNER